MVVYDIELRQEVLVVPWVMGMEGDNPMQSEMTSHIGMMGTCFCRMCTVRGKDDKARGGSATREADRRRDFVKVKHSTSCSGPTLICGFCSLEQPELRTTH